MKMAILLLMALCFLYFPGKGQVGPPSPNDQALQESLIYPAEYIFEGTVLQTKNYVTSNGLFITQAILEIHKVFRGDLNPGTIEIITGPTGYFFQKENLPKVNPWITISVSHGQSPGFTVGHTDLFLAQMASNIPSNTDCPVTNKFVVKEMERFQYSLHPQEFFSGYEAYLSGGQILQGKVFKKLQEVYNFILQAPNTRLVDFDHKTFQKLGRNGLPLTEN